MNLMNDFIYNVVVVILIFLWILAVPFVIRNDNRKILEDKIEFINLCENAGYSREKCLYEYRKHEKK